MHNPFSSDSLEKTNATSLEIKVPTPNKKEDRKGDIHLTIKHRSRRPKHKGLFSEKGSSTNLERFSYIGAIE